MGFELIITEKPKQAMRIAMAVADGKPVVKRLGGASCYEVTSDGKKIVVAPAVGHIFSLKEKVPGWEYPVFDVEWVPIFEVEKRAFFAKKYYSLLKSLAKEATSFTVSCDYDIEGELIGYNVLRFIYGQKSAARMKFSTLTASDLREAYKNKAKEINMGQALAGETRHVLDWYYGINVSRALTTALKQSGTFKVLSSGRVQGPALKIIVDREREILAFKSQPYWRIRYDGLIKSKKIEAYHAEDKFWEKAKASAIEKKCKGKDGKVEKCETKVYEQYAPHPFDLTSLQMEAYRWLHMSPQESLNHAQTLYLAGCISYPRTSSQKLPPQLGFRKIIQAIAANPEYKGLAEILLKKEKLWPYQGKKEDPAHPAIYPTGQIPKGVKGNAIRLYELIVKRFLATFGDPAKREQVKITFGVENEPFVAEGAITLEPGWHKLYAPFVKLEEVTLPKPKVGDKVSYKLLEMLEDTTKPPRRYSQASLVQELSNRNLGTKSTRAMIVDTLFKRGYATGQQIQATKLGMQIVSVLEKRVPDIIDEELTRGFEEDMEKILEGKKKETEVLSRAKGLLTKMLTEFKAKEKAIGKELHIANQESNQDAAIGGCPKCKKGLLLIRTSKNHKRFLACDKFPDCMTTFPIPQMGKVYKTDIICKGCGHPVIRIFNPGIKRTLTQCINPECNSNKSQNEGKVCPKCGKGKMAVRTSRFGRFLACDKYPDCKYVEKIQGKAVEKIQDKAVEKIQGKAT